LQDVPGLASCRELALVRLPTRAATSVNKTEIPDNTSKSTDICRRPARSISNPAKAAVTPVVWAEQVSSKTNHRTSINAIELAEEPARVAA
jgi:hypothetical protein